MAGVSTSISIQDKVTARMNKIITAFSRGDRAAQALDATTRRTDMAGAYNRVDASVNRAGRSVEDFNRKQESVRVGAEGIGGAWGRLGGLIQSAAASFGIAKVAGLSDQMATIQARLDLMNDGLQTTAELQAMIMNSANRSRAGFLGTADAVSKMGIMAKDAFGSNAELIAFSELINKQFVIAGTSAAGVDAAMLQLTQAMASGVLRGEELNSVFEQAPTIIQTVAAYLDVPIGKIRDMAAEGQITATIVKNAMLSAADEINARFEAMPMTWGQVWAKMSNMALQFLQPLLTGINWLANNIGIIAPLVLGLGTAFLVFQLAANWTAIATAITGAYKFAVDVLSLGFAVLTGRTGAASAATLLFNSALLASPITWVVMGIALLVGLLYAGVAAFNKFTGSAVSATGLIGGAFAVLGAHILNTFAIPLWNTMAAIANFVGNVFRDPIGSIKILFLDMAKTVLGYIRNIAAGIEGLLNKIPGINVDLTSGMDRLYSAVEDSSQKVKDQSGWVEYVKSKSFIDYGAAANAGYEFGSGLADKVSGLFGGAGGGDDLLAGTDIPNVGKVGEVGKINDDVNIAEEDLQLMKDVAEMRYVQNFVTLTPTVSMSAKISERVDKDAVVASIAQVLEDEVAAYAEGVYA